MLTWRAVVERLTEWPRGFSRPLPSADGVSRRAFLHAAGVGLVAIAALPATLQLDAPMDLDAPSGLTVAEFDTVLRDIWTPVIRDYLERESPFARLFAEDGCREPRSIIVPLRKEAK